MSKVLLAEDDSTMASLLDTLLKMEGYQVAMLMGKNGDILDHIRQEKPDVILMDVFLGDRNGLDLVRKIRQAPDLETIKVIMTSGTDKADESMAAGADDFLLKPFMPDDLLRKLRNYTLH